MGNTSPRRVKHRSSGVEFYSAPFPLAHFGPSPRTNTLLNGPFTKTFSNVNGSLDAVNCTGITVSPSLVYWNETRGKYFVRLKTPTTSAGVQNTGIIQLNLQQLNTNDYASGLTQAFTTYPAPANVPPGITIFFQAASIVVWCLNNNTPISTTILDRSHPYLDLLIDFDAMFVYFGYSDGAAQNTTWLGGDLNSSNTIRQNIDTSTSNILAYFRFILLENQSLIGVEPFMDDYALSLYAKTWPNVLDWPNNNIISSARWARESLSTSTVFGQTTSPWWGNPAGAGQIAEIPATGSVAQIDRISSLGEDDLSNYLVLHSRVTAGAGKKLRIVFPEPTEADMYAVPDSKVSGFYLEHDGGTRTIKAYRDISGTYQLQFTYSFDVTDLTNDAVIEFFLYAGNYRIIINGRIMPEITVAPIMLYPYVKFYGGTISDVSCRLARLPKNPLGLAYNTGPYPNVAIQFSFLNQVKFSAADAPIPPSNLIASVDRTQIAIADERVYSTSTFDGSSELKKIVAVDSVSYPTSLVPGKYSCIFIVKGSVRVGFSITQGNGVAFNSTGDELFYDSTTGEFTLGSVVLGSVTPNLLRTEGYLVGFAVNQQTNKVGLFAWPSIGGIDQGWITGDDQDNWPDYPNAIIRPAIEPLAPDSGAQYLNTWANSRVLRNPYSSMGYNTTYAEDLQAFYGSFIQNVYPWFKASYVLAGVPQVRDGQHITTNAVDFPLNNGINDVAFVRLPGGTPQGIKIQIVVQDVVLSFESAVTYPGDNPGLQWLIKSDKQIPEYLYVPQDEAQLQDTAIIARIDTSKGSVRFGFFSLQGAYPPTISSSKSYFYSTVAYPSGIGNECYVELVPPPNEESYSTGGNLNITPKLRVSPPPSGGYIALFTWATGTAALGPLNYCIT